MRDLAAHAGELDAADPLAGFRDRFSIREGLIYLDGNSLGCLPKATAGRMQQVIGEQWGEGLITSWLDADWSTMPQRVGDKIAQLIGANEGEVIAADSTSVNIFKALTAAISLRPGRGEILTETTNFPTDAYMMQGIETFSGGRIKARAVPPDDLLDAVDENTAAVLLTHVHYKSAKARDLAETTRRIQQSGALVIWDLSHSTGALELDLNAANADFAVGCGYKFLNGGPGAPAFLFAAQRNHNAEPVLSGWFGHAKPFAFEEDYQPAGGVDRFLCGTPYVLGLAALEVGVDLMLEVDIRHVRTKSNALGDLLIEAMEPLCSEFGFELAGPANSAERGSHIGYAHENAYAMVQALREKDVIADFRTPEIIRFGLTPLYLRHSDILDAVERLTKVCRTRSWNKPEYRTVAAVT